MDAQDLTLNIAVNLGRLCRFASEKKIKRVEQFLTETNQFVDQLDKSPKKEKFMPTYQLFKVKFGNLLQNHDYNEEWAEEALTWANILSHRAKLA